MQLYGFMTPTGYQYPGPDSGPQGVASVVVDVPRSILHFEVQFTDVKKPFICRFYVVAGDKMIGGRQLPPSTDDTITDDWSGVPSQVMQSIVANPSNAIVYVEAPPNTLPREYLPGGGRAQRWQPLGPAPAAPSVRRRQRREHVGPQTPVRPQQARTHEFPPAAPRGKSLGRSTMTSARARTLSR
jgi:hypothetical protein